MASQLFKVKLFWRILVADAKYISRQRFLTRKSAQRCLDMQDAHGLSVIEYKRKENKMPVRKVNGGFRYGTTGKVYKSKAKAIKQGIAIRASQRRAGKRVK